MSDNKINPDSEEPHHNKIPLNNPEDKETPGETTPEEAPLEDDKIPTETSGESAIEKAAGDENISAPLKEIEQVENAGNDQINKEINIENTDDLKPSVEELAADEKTIVTANDLDLEDNSSDDAGNSESIAENKNIETSPSEEIKTETDSQTSEEETTVPVVKPALTLKSKESNYQISLVSENLLKVLVTSKKSGVKIDSIVKDSSTSLVTQSNEIYYNPRIDLSLQEVEVLIAIDEDEAVTETEALSSETIHEIPPDENTENAKSNYQINLINENLLKVRISTGNGVHIDSAARDKKNLFQTQSNKIYHKQLAGKQNQDIEITVAIDNEPVFAKDDLSGTGDDGKIRLIPNPEVVDLIQPPDYSPFMQGEAPYMFEDNSYKNPFDALRQLIRKNITIGLIAAVILHIAVAGFAFYTISKKSKNSIQEEPQRLIVLQDLPDPKIKLEDVEDPNKPKIEPPVITEEQEKEMKEKTRELPPRKIVKPPTVTRPKREETKLDSSVEASLERELDSLRRLREEMFADSNLVMSDSDSVKTDSVTAAYEIPDSLRNNFNENDIGLAMYFPKNWKLTDQREINKNEKEFKGVVITDTTAEQPGTMTMFIFLDNENKDYNAEDFKTEFKMLDSNLTGFSKEPKTLAGFTEYRFYIFNKLGTEKLSLRASVRKQFFEQYKNEIEAVVRSIRIKKKEDM